MKCSEIESILDITDTYKSDYLYHDYSAIVCPKCGQHFCYSCGGSQQIGTTVTTACPKCGEVHQH